MKRDRRLARHLTATPTPDALRERIRTTLPATNTRAAAPARGAEQRRRLAIGLKLAAGAALGLGLVLFIPWKSGQPFGAAVEAAVQRANTWHLRGWKLHGGQRVPWEVWGRREPFFYREQIGEELKFDDGKQRIWLLARHQPGEQINYNDGRKGARRTAGVRNGSLTALRMPSGDMVTDQWRSFLTEGTGWRNLKPLHRTRNRVVVSLGYEGGMHGPYTEADSRYTVDRRTWLPVLYEYRQSRRDTREQWIGESLRAEYDIALPQSVTTLQLPEGVRMVDALGPPDAAVPTEGVQRARGLTLKLEPLAMEDSGIVLAKVSCWLGSVKLGAKETQTGLSVRRPFRLRAVGQTPRSAYQSDTGRQYVDFRWPGIRPDFENGDELMLFAPLEPLPPGAPLPRTLTLNLEVWPYVHLKTSASTPLYYQEFVYSLPLPQETAPIQIDDHLPPGHRKRAIMPPDMANAPVAASIAAARSNQYHILRNYDRAIYWQRQGLGLVEQFTNEAQARRLDLAHLHHQAGNLPQAAAEYREVIRIHQRHPKTWSYYAYQARMSLKRLPRQRAGGS